MPKRLSRRSKRASLLHLPFDKKLPQFLLVASTSVRSKRQGPRARGFLSEARGKSASSSRGKAQRKLGQGVQTPRSQLKHVYRVADAPCVFETPCLTCPSRALRVVLPRIDDLLLLTPSRISDSTWGLPLSPNGAYPPRATPDPIAARVAKPPQRSSFE